MTIVAVIVVRRTAVEVFRRYEALAARIIAAHGGAIEHVLVEDTGEGDTIREVHWVTFPSDHAWQAYRADPELAALAPLRAESVVATDLVIGEPAAPYR